MPQGQPIKGLPQIVAERDMAVMQQMTQVDMNIIQEMMNHVQVRDETIKHLNGLLAGIKEGTVKPDDLVGNQDGWDTKPTRLKPADINSAASGARKGS